MVALLLTGCAQATPFPITPIPSRTPTLEPGAAPPDTPTPEIVRYGLLPNAAAYAPLDIIEGTGAQVDVLTETSDFTAYDILAGYGLFTDWTEVPTQARVSLAIDITRPPLDTPDIAAIVRHAAQPREVLAGLDIPGAQPLTAGDDSAALRQQLANAGYPDGFTLYGTADSAPGTDALLRQFSDANIIIRPTTSAYPHLRVNVWHEAGTRATLTETYGEENVIDLYTLPISYRAAPDLDVTFTADGWVLP